MRVWAIASTSLAFLVLGIAAFLQFRAAEQIADLEAHKHALRRQLAEASAAREDTEARLLQEERRLGTLDREFAASQARVANLSAQLRQSQLEARQLNSTVATLTAEKETLEDQAARFRRELLEARSQPARLDFTEQQAFEREIEDLRAQLALAKRRPPPPESLAVEVLSVSARGDVIAVNRGTRAGLQAERTALLQRDAHDFARLRFTEVSDEWSLAQVVHTGAGHVLAKGAGYHLVLIR